MRLLSPDRAGPPSDGEGDALAVPDDGLGVGYTPSRSACGSRAPAVECVSSDWRLPIPGALSKSARDRSQFAEGPSGASYSFGPRLCMYA